MFLASPSSRARFGLFRAAFSFLAAAAALVAQTTIVDDSFADGNRTSQNPPPSVNWFINTGTGLTQATSVGSFQFNNSSSRLLVGYFTAAGAPVSVAVGQSITLEITFSSDVTPANVTNGFNLALLNSGGARLAADFSGTSNSAFTNYDGYGTKTNGLGSTTGSNITLRRRNAASRSTALMSTSGDWTTVGSGSGATGVAAANTTYVATVTITNNGASAALAYSVKTANGATTLHNVAGNDTAAAGVLTSFDAVALYLQTAELPSGNLILQRVRVTTSGGTPTAPTIATQPVTQSANVGDTVTFTAAANGNPAPTYQWFKNNAPLGGATGTSLTLGNVQLADAGDYTFVATNSVGFATSNVATLTVLTAATAPAIATQPTNQSVVQGTTATFTVAATGSAPLSYQWSKNNVAINGATAATLGIANAQPANEGSYSVRVSNSVGFVDSNAVTLTVRVPPAIATPPAAQTVNVGDTATFSVVATGTAPLSYQWKKDGGNVGGATSATLTLANAQPSAAGSYTVVVTNSAGSVTSPAATLTVNSAPAITAQPQAVATTVGSNATFTVTASGTPTPTFQWFKNNAPIPGANAATLALANVQFADAGSYYVVATNALGTATSNAVTLAVSAPSPLARYNLTGFATLNGGTSGGGVIPETDPTYVKVATPLEFANALILAAKTAGAVKVIEIMNDLNLGWNEIGPAVQGLSSNPFRSHATPKLHPVLIATGVSVIDIKPKSGLTIFSANGSTVRHATFNIKGASNILLRNLRFDEMWEWDEATKGDYDSNDWDFITLSNGGAATNIWIDHCTFTKAYDGVADMKAGTQFVTLSWCKYVGDDGATNANSFVRQQLAALEANRPAYAFYNFLRTNGFSVEDIVTIIQGHDKGHLMGSNSLDSGNATLSATFHHQWFNNLWDRCVPRLRAGNVHNYNLYVDDTGVLAAKRLRDTRAAALTTALRNTLNNTYSFNPPINGCISTEGGALLLEKSSYVDCLWPLRNNQTDPSNPVYTGKILALDSRYVFHNADGTTSSVRGNSTDAGNPMGPFQAAIVPFAWNGYGAVPYSYTPDDPDELPTILAIGAGAGALTWSKDNWLKTAYTDPASAPTIDTPPQAQTAIAGTGATFTVTATGTAPLGYQWKKNGAAIPDATAASFTLASVTAADEADYTVVVTNLVGTATSAAAHLTVLLPPAIVSAPTSQTVTAFDPVSFSVTATGSAPLSYQWSKDGAPIPGATAATLALGNVTTATAGGYAVTVSNAAGSATRTANLVVNPATATVALSDLDFVFDGNAKTPTATVTPAGLAVVFSYNDDPIAPANAGSYAVVATVVDANYAGRASGTLTIARANPVLAWSAPAPVVYGTALGAAQLNATANVAGGFVYAPAAGTVLDAGANQLLHATFVPDDTRNFNGAVATTPITVDRAPASVGFSNLDHVYDGSAQHVTATPTPANVAFTLTYEGSGAAPANAGSYHVVATITDPNYTGGGEATLTIAPATPHLAWSAPASIVYGTALGAAQLNATANVAGAFVYTPAAGTVLAAGPDQPLTAFFTPADAQNYRTGSVATTLTVEQALATLTLSSLRQNYDGTPRAATVDVNPTGLAFDVTYNGGSTVPTLPGAYAVVATVNDPNYRASASGKLLLRITALVTHAPTFGGLLDGSAQVLSAEALALNGSATVSGDLLVRGTPTVQFNGHPTYASTLDATGLATPTDYAVTLGGNAVLRHVVRRVDPIALPEIPAFAPGTRDIALTGNAGLVALAPGDYANVSANANTTLVLGTPNSDAPAVYHVQTLAIKANAKLQVVGPVVVLVANGATLSGNAGVSSHPEWLTLTVRAGNLTVDGNAIVHGDLATPAGTLTLGGSSSVTGHVAADRLALNGTAHLQEGTP